jgi:hypothetical protein
MDWGARHLLMNIQLVSKWRLTGLLDNLPEVEQEKVALYWEDAAKRTIAATWGR